MAELARAGFDVPEWFAVTAEEELGGEGWPVLRGFHAVRSSAVAEDGAEHSFAGQFDTFLFVPAEEVLEKVKAVRESAGKEAVLAYCREKGIGEPAVPCVLVQRMVDPKVAGVAFSADPVSGRRNVAVVAAAEGTGEKLVSGEVDGETWQLARSGEVLSGPEEALLRAAEAKGVADLARRCETHFGRPQDIEWAIDGEGKLWLLQSRPITTLPEMPDPDDPIRVWDNSNIAESYGGVTTPLTFSFAKRIYEHVYREFCKLMSVPAVRIERADDVFPQMLGLIRGRTYYNLGSWYRVLALLPGFQVNRAFMEQMMGVREPLPEPLVEKIVVESRTGKLGDTIALMRTCGGLVRRLAGLGKQVKAFQVRLDGALADVDLGSMSGDELVSHYRELERKLLRKWDAPLVNDFFAMIFYGVLRGLCKKWVGDEDGTMQNGLLAETGGIISAEPPKRIREMADLAAGSPELVAVLADTEIGERMKLEAMKGMPELHAKFEEYLCKFGDRCLEELKLESPTVRDDASTLLISIGVLAGRKQDEAREEPAAVRVEIGNPVKRWIFGWVLGQTRERIRCRENLRFERTRLFGRVRGIVRELGRRLSADGRLAAADDVFHLELGEIFSAWEGTETTGDLNNLAEQRRREFREYEETPAPPDRFETRGAVHRYVTFEGAVSPEREPLGDEIRGTGACPGIVRGRVRVVLDPRGARLEAGEILVAKQTDPGWVVLFPSAAGLLVERGSLLSHSAIVSRELRLPCIVSLPGITASLKTGDEVEMNGATGTIRILSS